MRVARAARVGTVSLLLAALVAGGGLYVVRRELLAFAVAPFRAREGGLVDVFIPKGADAQQIATILEERGIIGDATLFHRWVRFVVKKEAALKAGDYELSPAMTPEQIVALLEAGRPMDVRLTVPEGLRKEEVAGIIAAAGFGKKNDIIAWMNDPKTVTAFGVPAVGADGQPGVGGGIDGYLFPDTYQFRRSATPERILRRMRARLDEVIDDEMKARMAELDWTLHTTLTLAAIVEKETAAKEERARISAVFHNRMQRGMRLQTDPTVIYASRNYDGNIRKADLQRAHPYNTYVIRGLPPGPIAQPGLAAIRAALWPSETSDVFFVAKGDSGQHEFCPDLDCHNAAVQKWQVEFWAKKRGG